MRGNILKIAKSAALAAIIVVMVYGAFKADYHTDVLSDEYARLKQAISAGELIRLHIIADSDEPDAQRLKLAVRDALLDTYAQRLSALNAGEARALLPAIIPDIERTAIETAQASGFDGTVSVSFGKDSFPYREYAGMPVPAGTYDSLIICIGSARGRNWWCVMYPPLCMLTPDTLDAAIAVSPDTRAERPAARPLISAPDNILKLPQPSQMGISYTSAHTLTSARIAIARADAAITTPPQPKPLFRSAILDWLKAIF